MAEIETIPIPTDRAKRKDPIHLRVNHLDAWPNHNFILRFDWNSVIRRWVWEMERVGDGKLLFPRAPVCLARPYTHKGYLMAMFIDPGRTEDRVGARNLGEEVKLAVFAGPDSEGWDPGPEPSEERF